MSKLGFIQTLKNKGIIFATQSETEILCGKLNQDDISYRLLIIFVRDFLSKIVIQEFDFFSSLIPDFLIKNVALRWPNFTRVSESKFLFDPSSITISSEVGSIGDCLAHVVFSFCAFTRAVKKEFEIYSDCPMDWIQENVSEKKGNSYHACWNIPKGNSCISVDSEKYQKITGEYPPSGFTQVNVVVLEFPPTGIKILALKKGNRENNQIRKCFEFKKAKIVEFPDVLKEIVQVLFQYTDVSDSNLASQSLPQAVESNTSFDFEEIQNKILN